MNHNELCVVNTTEMNIWAFTTEENKNAELERAIQYNESSNKTYRRIAEENPENGYWKTQVERTANAKFAVMTYAEFARMEREELLGQPMQEIDETTYREMFDILPPMKWCTRDGVEMFCMCEMYTGSYTNQYAHDLKSGKFYTKLVDVRDTSTWINEILKKENKG